MQEAKRANGSGLDGATARQEDVRELAASLKRKADRATASTPAKPAAAANGVDAFLSADARPKAAHKVKAPASGADVSPPPRKKKKAMAAGVDHADGDGQPQKQKKKRRQEA